MNIGIVTTWYECGASYVSRAYRDALRNSHSVYIYVRGGDKQAKGDPNWDQPNVYWGKQVISPFAVGVIEKRDFVRWLKEKRIDVVLFNEQKWWIPLLWCRELGIHTVAYVDYYTEETVPLFSAYDLLLCNTKRHFSVFSWHSGARYIPWGTDTALYRAAEPASLVEREQGDVVFFTSCGDSPYRKGTDLLLKAFILAPSARKLIIHSQVSLHKMIPQVSDTIRALSGQGRLEVIEKTVTAPGLYRLGDVYVYPSRLDGIGLSLPEALASGLCAVVPDEAPMNEFVSARTGALIRVGSRVSRADGYYWPKCMASVEDLARILEEMAKNKDLVQQQKEQARSYALAHLNWAANASSLPAVFEAITPSPYSDVESRILSFEFRGPKKMHGAYLRLYPLADLGRRALKKWQARNWS